MPALRGPHTDPKAWRTLTERPSRAFDPPIPPVPTIALCPTCNQQVVRYECRKPRNISFVLYCEYCSQYYPVHRDPPDRSPKQTTEEMPLGPYQQAPPDQA